MKMIAPLALDAATARSETRYSAAKLTGLVLIALLPALFWTAVLALVSNAIGLALSSAALIVTAAAIALFLTVVYAALATGAGSE
ncbi:MAG: hypothetical protein KJ587_02465 [Alphaproteobacteria bacterium]|nr:hypothetical protein [Alphaproteobacteria bacterium]